MKMECCRLCKNLRGHWYLKAVIQHELDEECHLAQQEYANLLRLYKSACWYNFEIACLSWKHPWHTTDPNSSLHLRSDNTVWFTGTVNDAPTLPLLILQNEIELAHAHMRYCEQSKNAAFDWAPGGCKYDQLLQLSPTVKQCTGQKHRT
ncbi:hypothetical protein [Pleurochrysis sp. endemic virus 2]|nr:hypothetical protein [Pleurochrysis sp. endemic virus 2]